MVSAPVDFAWRPSARHAWVLVVFLVAALWVAFRYPGPQEFISDPDGGYQLAGAMEILSGEPPFLSFRENYGPLTFYASALGQFISGERVIGEFGLVVIGYASAYTLLFVLFLRFGRNRVLPAILFTLVALALLPRLYKYYIVLFPVLALWTMWRYLEQPTTGRLRQLGLAIATTGLFRPDFGVYTFLAGIFAIVVADRDATAEMRTKRSIQLCATVVAVASPWLLWVSLHGGLQSYLVDSSVGAANSAVGLALPIAAFNLAGSIVSIANVRAVLFRAFLLVPLVSAVVLVVKWKQVPRIEGKQIYVAIVLAQLTLLQSMFRSDWGHLLQAIPISLVLLAWLNSLTAAGSGQRLSSPASCGRFAVLSGLAVILFRGADPWNDSVQFRPELLWQKISLYSGTKAQLLAFDRRIDPTNWIVRTVDHIRSQTQPDQRIVVAPAYPQIFYLSDRLPGGGQLAVLPGYFSSPADQATFIQRLRDQNVGALVLAHNQAIDGQSDRMMEQFASGLLSYLTQHFEPILQVGPVVIYRPKSTPSAVKGP